MCLRGSRWVWYLLLLTYSVFIYYLHKISFIKRENEIHMILISASQVLPHDDQVLEDPVESLTHRPSAPSRIEASLNPQNDLTNYFQPPFRQSRHSLFTLSTASMSLPSLSRPLARRVCTACRIQSRNASTNSPVWPTTPKTPPTSQPTGKQLTPKQLQFLEQAVRCLPSRPHPFSTILSSNHPI